MVNVETERIDSRGAAGALVGAWVGPNNPEKSNNQGGRWTCRKRQFLLAAAATPVRLAIAESIQPAKSLNLKITGIKTFVVNSSSTVNWVFCKVYTNQGLIGLGEGSVTSKEATVAQAIMEHERYLVGKDPTDIEMHWQAMFRYPRWRGGPILNSAIATVGIKVAAGAIAFAAAAFALNAAGFRGLGAAWAPRLAPLSGATEEKHTP